MKSKLTPVLIVLILVGSASCKKDTAGKNEVWPKTGYLITTDGGGDTVYVEAGNLALTSPYIASIGVNDTEERWTITIPTSGEGVLIHNERNEYWSIDSAFHPGLNIEQHFISVRNTNDPSSLSDFNRFKYHKADDDGAFYIESVAFPGTWVVALGHAESGRGLRLRSQTSGDWKFWLTTN